MFMKLLRRLYSLSLVLAIASSPFAATLPVSVSNAQSTGFVDRAGGAYQRIEVMLQADGAPEPGGVASLTFSATPLLNAPDLTITWQLPDGGELLGGPASEPLGFVSSGSSVQQTRQVRFPAAGVYTVLAQASYHPDGSSAYRANGVLFFTIDAGGSSISDLDPRTPRYEPPPAKMTIDKSGMAAAAGSWGPDAPQGCFNVFGVLTREERVPTTDAAGNASYNDLLGNARPVHHILVEMREEDTISDDSYGYTVTDANGFFQFNFCDDDGVLNDELELYIRVCSEVWDGPRIARIEDATEAELYCFDSGTKDSEGGAVDFSANYTIPQIQAAIFNIGDSLYWASRFWNINNSQGSPTMDRSVNLRWEAGKGAKGSFYSASNDTIVLADDPSSFDQWDDSVIIHEWGHFADEQFSCNQNPGGTHALPGWNPGPGGDQLSWGEGYPDYYQSAARTIMPNPAFLDWYIDVDGPTVNFETLSGTAGDRNEGAIASLMWDLMDATNDISDTVAPGHARIQRVLTDPAFQGNPQCNMRRFLKVWKDVGYPTDAATAATVVQNVNIANPFAAASAAAASTESPAAVAGVQAVNAASPYDYRWWDQVTMVVDNSTSMAGQKLDAVKSLIHEQENDFNRNPKGTEYNLYAFNSANPLIPLKERRFFVGPELYGLEANGADAGCPVLALDALTKAAEDKYDGQAWVYTDGEAQKFPSASYFQQQLNERLIHGSIVMLAGCNSTTPTAQPDISGAEKSYLGVAADGSQPGSIVPYLLTALGTGGQFLYVPPDQLANAADILIAQSNHSAGAGRWSDYVSDNFTYRWDRLQSWEANYYPVLDSLQEPRGALSPDSPKRIDLGGFFDYYGVATNAVDVYQDGYLLMNPCDNPILCLPGIDQYAYILEGEPDLEWAFIDNPNLAAAGVNQNQAAQASPDQDEGPQVWVWSGNGGDGWYIISTEGEAIYGNGDTEWRAYQIWLNLNSGEIRYLYDRLRPVDTNTAKVGVADALFTGAELIVSNRSTNGPTEGMGYKFTPAPPQPTKTYTVAVDSQIQSVGFLQTGYSGSFAPLIVQYPDGTAVDCSDTANVICLSLNNGLLQYVQVDANGQTGVYSAIIDAGDTGEGTFSFNAIGASPIHPAGLGKRTLDLGANPFQVDLGLAADGNQLTGWLQTATGARFGAGFALYDDGAHGDELVGDGIFGSDDFTPPGQGVAYLWVQGALNGEGFARSDPAPYNFQPIKVEPEPAYVPGFLGQQATIGFAVTNQDRYDHCYNWEVSVPPGWTFDGSSGSPFCVGDGETAHPKAYFTHPLDDQPGGVASDFNATFTEVEEGRIVGGASVSTTYFRPLAAATIDNRWLASYLRPNNTDTVTMTVNLLDDQGQISGWSGFLGYDFSTTLGTLTAPTGFFENGRMPLVFTAGDQTGEALITVQVEGGAVATTTLQIRNPFATDIDLVATPTDLRGDVNESTLVATLVDDWGDAVVGQSVRLSVSGDDGTQGTIAGGEVFTGTTNAQGQVSAAFAEGEEATGTVVVRAEALVPSGGAFRTSQEDIETLIFTGAGPGNESSILLPLVRNGRKK